MADFSDLETAILDEAARLRDEALVLVLESVKEDCPVGQDVPLRKRPPGHLRDSFEIEDTFEEPTMVTGTIGTDVEYAQFTDEVDTNPHLIFAITRPRLVFWWEDGPHGPDVYQYRFVRHPGTTGQRWFKSRNQERWTAALNRVAG